LEEGMKRIVVLAVVIGVFTHLLWAQNAATPAQAVQRKAVADELVDLINAGNYAAIQKLFTPEMDEALPAEKTAPFFDGLKKERGNIVSLGEARREGQWTVYPVQFQRGELDLKLATDSKRRISGLFFGPKQTPARPPERNATKLSLPFKGDWLVFWGGDTREVNYHHDTPNQKFALDLLGVGENGKTRRGLSNRNEDYYAFGREVLAPGDGVVVEAIDGVRDNEPGSMNPYSVVGNCVVIQHSTNEFSVIAHFKQGTVRVKAGDRVKRGDLLGLCGNSGNSSEPHIHFHLQHNPWLQNGLSIKPFFENVTVRRSGSTKLLDDYSPVKGDIISPR
jgi:murein DD-endopeptidase MepM/ murein hydrolase activator NlpD